MSFGKKSTNNTSINVGGIVCGATSSSASSDSPHPLPQVSEAGEEIMISSGTKRTRSVIESANDNDSVDVNNSSFTLSCTTDSSGNSKVTIFDV